jgi:hypothetical protein
MKMCDIRILDRLRGSSVERWHIVNTSKSQNVGDHSFNVAHIAMELCVLIRREEWIPDVAVLALEHDLEEVFTGDIPTCAKEDKGWPYSVAPSAIIKIADFIEAMVFIGEYHVDRHGERVYRDYQAKYLRMLAHWEQQGEYDLKDAISALVDHLER